MVFVWGVVKQTVNWYYPPLRARPKSNQGFTIGGRAMALTTLDADLSPKPDDGRSIRGEDRRQGSDEIPS